MLIGYMRVSKVDGSQSLDLQRDSLVQAGVDPNNIYQDLASGKRDDRPGFAACLKALRRGDTLVVWKLDRLARSMKQLIETAEMLDARKIGLRSLTENIDTTTSGGRLVFHLFGALAEFERSIIRERTTAGLTAARARGRVGGRPKALDDSDLAVARALLSDPNITTKEVAERLGVSVSTLYKHIPAARAVVTNQEPA